MHCAVSDVGIYNRLDIWPGSTDFLPME